jgi:hypothetical protein
MATKTSMRYARVLAVPSGTLESGESSIKQGSAAGGI